MADEEVKNEAEAAAEEPKAEEPAAEAPKAEAPKAEAPAKEEPKAEAPKAEEKPVKKERAKGSDTVEDIIAKVKTMTVIELADLVKALESEFGVSAAAPVAVAAAAPAGGGGAAEDAEEQTEFTVMLTEIGANKINVIKAVRELTALGLKESKDLVEGAPQPVKEGIGKEEAAAAKAKLEAAGAKAEIK